MSAEQKYIMSIGFSKPKETKLFSWLIQLFEGTDFSHTFVTWKCTNINRRKVYEAVGSGSRKISNKMFKKKAQVIEIYQFEVTCDELFLIDQMTHDQAGTPYGYKHVLGLLCMRAKNFIARLFGCEAHHGNPFKDSTYSQICVEAGAYVVEISKKVDLPGNIEDYGLREFHSFVAKHGEKVPQEKIDRINRRS